MSEQTTPIGAPPGPETGVPQRTLAPAMRRLDPAEALARTECVPDAAPPVSAPLAPGVPDAPPGLEIVGELGRGGMGVVYRARQAGLNREVALKTILAGAHAGPGDVARFLTEAEAVAKLDHAHVVRVLHSGTHGGLPYLVMEYVEGGTLAQRLTAGPLAPPEAARLVERLALGVAYCHARGVLHRDLKPANVLLAADGTPKVGDFGLARLADSAVRHTRPGAAMGTPSYMAPEQAEGDGARMGPATDVWGLGAILYAALTGRPPFLAPSAVETLALVRASDPVPPRDLSPGLPPDLETVVLKCLAKDPAARYATADALAADLARWRQGEPIAARPAGPCERATKWVRRHRALAASGGLLALLLAGGALLAAGLAAWAVRAEALATARLEHARHAEAEALRLAAEAERHKSAVEAARRRAPLEAVAFGRLCGLAARLSLASSPGGSADFRRVAARVVEAEPALKPALDDFAAALDGWRGGPVPPPLRRKSLAVAKACRSAWLDPLERDSPEAAARVRRELYARAAASAAALLSANDPARVRLARREVWELYWGELGLVEGPEVEGAMVELGRVLDAWPEGAAAPPGLPDAVARLRSACRFPGDG